jgi:hypothetical protein
MATPNPLPWPQSAQVIPIRTHKRQRAARISEGEIIFTRWEDGEEEITLRIFCDRNQCSSCACDTDHLIRFDPNDAARFRAVLHELTE